MDGFYYLYRCADCTHQFVYPSITATQQSQIYSDKYFEKDGDWVCDVFEASYVDAEPKLRSESRAVLAMIEKRGRLLDIGCAGGVFLDEARVAGYEVTGIELNASMAQMARDKFGLDVVNGRIEDVEREDWGARFDVVTMLDVLEHVPAPLEALRKIGGWMRPGAQLLIRGPLANDPIARGKERLRRVAGIRKRIGDYPLDANVFNKRSLTRMLALSGFTVTRWIGETRIFSNLLATRLDRIVPI